METKTTEELSDDFGWFEEGFQAALEGIRAAGLYRSFPSVEAVEGGRIRIGGRWLVHLSSNSALGLHLHPAVRAAAREAVDRFGAGAGAARLLGGHLPLHEALEEKLARFKQTEAALTFSTGYMANLGVIAGLLEAGDCVIVDHLNHASLIDACRLSGATLRAYPHKEMHGLERALAQRPGRFRRRWIVTEGIFSMDGDPAPLPDILDLAQRYEAGVILDDAHGTGVMGPTGRGTLEHFGLAGPGKTPPPFLLQVGTLSKSLGSMGGFVAGSRVMMDTLRNKSRPFIYTTALPPASAAAALAALEVIEREPALRRALWEKIHAWEGVLTGLGVTVSPAESHIVPFQAPYQGEAAGSTGAAMGLSAALFNRGIFAPGIRPPTVPEGTARIRTAVNAAHDPADLKRAADALADALKEKP